MNENTKYELFVKDIYNILHKSENIENIDICHNVELMGLTGCKHQIDIYWHFIMAGVEYQVAVECKNYTGKVPIGKIRDFNSALEDIGNINGVFVAKNGFQSGAITYAKQKKIKLIEMRHPSERDWEGRIKDIELDFHIYSKDTKKPIIEIDIEWCKKQEFLKNQNSVNISGLSNEITIEDLTNDTKTTLYELQNHLPVDKEGKGFRKIYEYDNAYIYSTSSPKIKFKKIIFEYDVICSVETVEINGDNIAKAIVKDIIDNTEQFVDINGNVRCREKI